MISKTPRHWQGSMHGNEAVRISLTLTLVGNLAGVALILYAAKTLLRDLALAEHPAQMQVRAR